MSGCYTDMFDAVMAALPYVVPYEYVPFPKADGSSAGSYDELAYQVSLQVSHAYSIDEYYTYHSNKLKIY